MITAELKLSGENDTFTAQLPDCILVEGERFKKICFSNQLAIAHTLKECGIRVIEIRLPPRKVGYYYKPASS